MGSLLNPISTSFYGDKGCNDRVVAQSVWFMINFLPKFSPGRERDQCEESEEVFKESEIPQGIHYSVVCWFDNGFQGAAIDFPDLMLAACGL